MEELTIQHLRQVLKETSTLSGEELEKISKLSDKEFLDKDMSEDYGFDSLDFVDLECEISSRHGIVFKDDAEERAVILKNPTVRNFINMCNSYRD